MTGIPPPYPIPIPTPLPPPNPTQATTPRREGPEHVLPDFRGIENDVPICLCSTQAFLETINYSEILMIHKPFGCKEKKHLLEEKGSRVTRGP